VCPRRSLSRLCPRSESHNADSNDPVGLSRLILRWVDWGNREFHSLFLP
jgi:hypothetical protein